MKFVVNQLVWAKMKGFPPWPGLVSEPPADMPPSPRARKNFYCVFFFGDKTYSWIEETNIQLYDGYENKTKKKSRRFMSALAEAENFRKQRDAELLRGRGSFKPCRVVLEDITRGRQGDVRADRGEDSANISHQEGVVIQASRVDESILQNTRLVFQVPEDNEIVRIQQGAMFALRPGAGRPDANRYGVSAMIEFFAGHWTICIIMLSLCVLAAALFFYF